jgi:protein-S-isoprenylcysteine O-methyltransferase Ste14
MRFDAGHIIGDLWLIFVLYWFVSALRLNRMRAREPIRQRLSYVLPLIAALAVVNWGDARFSFLGRRFIPGASWIVNAGVLVTAAGIAFAIWARYHIGRYWSGSVSLREGHQLIRRGPYACIRHPIYTGILLASAGTVVALGTYRLLAVFLILLAGFVMKAKREEALLSREFGAAFEEHHRQTGFFLPRLSQRPST